MPVFCPVPPAKVVVATGQRGCRSTRQVASDLGIGFSTLNKWVKAVADEAGPPDSEQNLLRENERLRRENRILKDLSRARKQSGRLFSRRMGSC